MEISIQYSAAVTSRQMWRKIVVCVTAGLEVKGLIRHIQQSTMPSGSYVQNFLFHTMRMCLILKRTCFVSFLLTLKMEKYRSSSSDPQIAFSLTRCSAN